MHQRVFLTFLFPGLLSAAEIQLKSGESFAARVVRQSEGTVLVEQAGRRFEIPMSDVLSIADRRPTVRQTFHLNSGERITGEVAREDHLAYTVATERGFEILDKKSVAKIDYVKSPLTGPPLRYALVGAEYRVGILASSATFQTGVANSHRVKNSGGAFVEPAWLAWRGLHAGYELSYGSAASHGHAQGLYFLRPVAELQFIEHLFYVTMPYALTGSQGLFLSAGAGIADVKFHPLRNQATVAMLRLGWEWKNGPVALRAALAGRGYFEGGAPQSTTGLELGAAYAF